MKVFQIKPDYKFWTLLPTTGAAFFADRDMFRFKPMREKWTVPNLYPRYPQEAVPGDFMNFAPGAIAMTDRVTHDSCLGKILKESGELLPAKLDGTEEQLQILNALVSYNCLDHANCLPAITPGQLGAHLCKKLAFHPSQIGDSSIFKVPELFGSRIFALSGRGEPKGEFYAEYHRLQLTGLVFEEVWSNEIG